MRDRVLVVGFLFLVLLVMLGLGIWFSEFLKQLWP